MNTPKLDNLKKYLIPIFERKATSITALDVSDLTSYTDTLVIVEAKSNRQTRSIAEHVIKQMKQLNIKVVGSEGVKKGEWALLDYGEVIIHVFESETKSLYDLEGFWADAPKLDLSDLDQAVRQDEEEEDGF